MSRLREIDVGAMARVAIVSDVHMRTPDDARTRAFVDYVRMLRGVDALVCLGDMFDFVYAGDAFYVKHWKEVFDAFAQLQERGMKVVFVEGNHDFGFEHDLHPTLESCFFVAADAVIRMTHPALGAVVLRHGDDVVCPPHYHAFRRVVKSRAFQRAASVVPGRVTNGLFASYARFSRTRDDYRTLDTTFLRRCVDEYVEGLRAEGRPAGLLVIGHVHMHLDFDAKATRVVAGPDWFVAPSVLEIGAEGTLSRTFLGEARVDVLKIGTSC